MDVTEILACPKCLRGLHKVAPEQLGCAACGGRFEIVDGIPVVWAAAADYQDKQHESTHGFEQLERTSTETHVTRDKYYARKTISFVERFADRESRQLCLNVGSQRCTDSYILARFGYEVVSLELEYQSLRAARELDNHLSGISSGYVCADGDWLPFENETFDVVFMRQALHHFDDLSRTLREMFRVTKKGGRVVVVCETITNALISAPKLFLQRHPRILGTLLPLLKALRVVGPSTAAEAGLGDRGYSLLHYIRTFKRFGDVSFEFAGEGWRRPEQGPVSKRGLFSLSLLTPPLRVVEVNITGRKTSDTPSPVRDCKIPDHPIDINAGDGLTHTSSIYQEVVPFIDRQLAQEPT